MFNKETEAIIGEVLSPHGVAGMVKVFPYTSYPERVKMLQELVLAGKKERLHLKVEKGVQHGRFWLIKFEGLNTRDEAALIKGRLLIIPKEKRLKLPEDSFYHDELVGLDVYETEGALVGKVTDIIVTGGHDVLQVERGQGQKNMLIPAVKRFVQKVSLAENRILVELPEGLKDL